MSDRLLVDALDDLVPRCEDAFGDWSDVLARAHVTTSATTARDATRRRYLTKRRLAIAGLLLAAVVALLATPAFGIRGLISDLFGRKNVHFNGQQAPLPVKRDFSDLSLGAPPGMDPGAIASQARKVATFRIDGKAHVLWVAPTRSGGFCETFTDMFGGCRKSRTPPKRYQRERGAVNPFLLGLTWMGSPTFRLPIYSSPIARISC